MGRVQGHPGCGQIGAVKAALAVHMFGGDQIAADGAVTARADRQIGPPGQFADHPGVARGQRQRHVARDTGQAQHLDFLRGGQRQQDRHGVILSGIGVDDDLPARHVSSLLRLRGPCVRRAAMSTTSPVLSAWPCQLRIISGVPRGSTVPRCGTGAAKPHSGAKPVGYGNYFIVIRLLAPAFCLGFASFWI
ncbi:hypothetical protein SAMN04488077_12619 [Roseovarius tolerans]|uniref:Uncharacterized protein n=1 Tax=Roseovarius tolerans TaxID=74031 RepID=A0A1H8J084_9RHOB|nr:hypothetical protein SAMN04488077_12619 [Roseovarius tolerans]